MKKYAQTSVVNFETKFLAFRKKFYDKLLVVSSDFGVFLLLLYSNRFMTCSTWFMKDTL